MPSVIQSNSQLSQAERDAGFRALIESEAKPATAAQLAIQLPDPIENGSVVPVAVLCTVPGTEAIALFVEDGGPFFVGAYTFMQGTEAAIGTRIRISRTAKVKAIALTPEGLLVAERLAVVEGMGPIPVVPDSNSVH
jgi:predicted secreted protein